MNIRPTNAGDIPALTHILTETDLFPPDLLPDMLSGFLAGGTSAECWLTCASDHGAIGFCYAAAEQLAAGTWNMLAIAVLPDRRGSGVGAALVQHLERILRADGQRVLIVDTSGSDAFARTRTFYSRNGYREEARIQDFWDTGDDKIVFWKAL